PGQDLGHRGGRVAGGGLLLRRHQPVRGGERLRQLLKHRAAPLTLSLLASLAGAAGAQNFFIHPAAVRSEFIYTAAPIPSVHASTIADTPHGVVAAWFGGSEEGAADVSIWLSRQVDGKWTEPVTVASGVEPDGRRFPCWNPVLAPWPDGTLRLFYKVGPSPARWWGMTSVSHDGGATWSRATGLPDGILGPVKNKPGTLSRGASVRGLGT